MNEIGDSAGKSSRRFLAAVTSIGRLSSLLVLISAAFVAPAAHASCTGSSPTWTTTIDQTSVASCISSASSGDTINVSSGTAAWSALTIPATKPLTLACPSGPCTISSDNALQLGSSGSPISSSTVGTGWRVTGFTFTNKGDSNNGDLGVWVQGTNPAFRVDHNTFDVGGDTQSVFLVVQGNDENNEGGGLIDHNSFKGGAASEEVHIFGSGNSNSSTVWLDSLTPGSAYGAIYVETNTFSNYDSTYICSATQSYFGARTVFRYNTLNFCQLDQHGTSGYTWARWWEVYNNTINSLSQEQCCFFVFRGGSGVAFNNTATGDAVTGDMEFQVENSACSGSYPAAGYPVPFQVGTGIITGGGTVHLSHAYLWNNTQSGSAMQINVTNGTAGSSASCVKQNSDFFYSASQPATLTRCESAADISAGCPVSYTYSPFTYPYPLNANGLPSPTNDPPPPPTNLAGIVQQN